MSFNRELRVGLTLVVTLAILLLGIRFFQDLPIFAGSYTLFTRVESAGGLTPGSAVNLRGVKVGTVQSVVLEQDHGLVRVDFKLHDGVSLPAGTVASVSGMSAFGSVTLTLTPGSGAGVRFAPGDEVPAAPSVDLLGTVSEQVPLLAARTDTALVSVHLAAGEMYALLSDPDSDLRLALAGLRQTTATLNSLIRAEAATLDRTLRNSEAFTSDLRAFSETHRDSLALAVTRLNGVLVRLDRNLATVETSTTALDSMLARVERGEGTLGMLLNDSTLFLRLDSTVTNANALLEEFRRDPRRYLRHLTLIDIF